jgi:hypothetical protein
MVRSRLALDARRSSKAAFTISCTLRRYRWRETPLSDPTFAPSHGLRVPPHHHSTTDTCPAAA